jgi:restriction system protein
MAIPDFQTLMLPVLKLFNEGAQNVAEILPTLQKQFQISDEEAAELNPSGTMTTFANRTHWARTYLSKAGLLKSPKRNQHIITEKARLFLVTNPARIDINLLKSFDDFNEWRDQSKSLEPDSLAIHAPVVLIENGQTPEDVMEAAHNTLNAALRDDILAILRDVNPVRFERLILDLLTAMKYGGGDLSNARLTKASGDGGIDGIIHEDALGLDAVYIQAKRYAPENKIGRPALQAFVGSLTGEGANKGVFVTTSDFSKEAKDYLNKVQHRIVLINGDRLARLMIQHEVGVRARKTYVLRSVDEDYFTDF